MIPVLVLDVSEAEADRIRAGRVRELGAVPVDLRIGAALSADPVSVGARLNATDIPGENRSPPATLPVGPTTECYGAANDL
ncbi:MAG TPA: hypothetical protein VGM05_26475 [Planctomycetaceae bacterium]|jgi:hypothetical protein